MIRYVYSPPSTNLKSRPRNPLARVSTPIWTAFTIGSLTGFSEPFLNWPAHRGSLLTGSAHLGSTSIPPQRPPGLWTNDRRGRPNFFHARYGVVHGGRRRRGSASRCRAGESHRIVVESMSPRLPAVVVTSVFLEVLFASAFLALGSVIGAIVALLFGLVIASLGIFALKVRKVADAASA